MKRTLGQALIFSVAILLIYYGVQVGLGYYRTLTYVPDIINAYASVDLLQEKVQFGYIVRPFGFVTEIAVLFVISMLAFIGGKSAVMKLRRTNRG